MAIDPTSYDASGASVPDDEALLRPRRFESAEAYLDRLRALHTRTGMVIAALEGSSPVFPQPALVAMPAPVAPLPATPPLRPQLVPVPDVVEPEIPEPDRRENQQREADRRRRPDRRFSVVERRRGLPDLRRNPVERRLGPADRRSGVDRREARDRRVVDRRSPTHTPMSVDMVALVWAIQVLVWIAIVVVVMKYGLGRA